MSSKDSEDDIKQAEEHVDRQLTFFRQRIDLLSEYGLEMEDFLFMEGLVKHPNSFPLYELYRLGLQHPQELGITNSGELRTFILGLIIGYARGLKETWPKDV